MSKQPRIGDTVLIRAEVIEVTDTSCFVSSPYRKQLGLFSAGFAIDEIEEIIDHSFQVGETVFTGPSSLPRTLVAIQIDPQSPQIRSWGVIVYKTDIPQVVCLSELRRTPECAA